MTSPSVPGRASGGAAEPSQRFEAVLEPTGKTATLIEIPFDVVAAFGSGRPPVRGTVNGFPFRSTLMRRGERYCMVVNRTVREGAGASAGETVRVEMERDDEPRSVDLPPELAAALAANPDALASYERLSYSHQKEYADWIGEAKREATRLARAERAIDMLREGKTQR